MPRSSVSAVWVAEAGESMGFDLSDEDAERFARGVTDEIDGYAVLDELAPEDAANSKTVGNSTTLEDDFDA